MRPPPNELPVLLRTADSHLPECIMTRQKVNSAIYCDVCTCVDANASVSIKHLMFLFLSFMRLHF